MSTDSNRRGAIRATNAMLIATATTATTMLTVILADHRSIICVTAALAYKILDRVLEWMTPEQFAALIEALSLLM